MEKGMYSLLAMFVGRFYKPKPVKKTIPRVAAKKRIAPEKEPESKETPKDAKKGKTLAKPRIKPQLSTGQTPRTEPRKRQSFAARKVSDEDLTRKKQAQEAREKRIEERKEKYREERERRRVERKEQYRQGLLKESSTASAKMRASMDLDLPPLEKTFREHLFTLIQKKDMDDVEVYKKAQIDRRLFSKIRSDANYTPSKATVIALAMALQLNLSDAKDLLQRAGYALSRSQLSDVIVEFFFTYRKYDLFAINEALELHGLPILWKVRE